MLCYAMLCYAMLCRCDANPQCFGIEFQEYQDAQHLNAGHRYDCELKGILLHTATRHRDPDKACYRRPDRHAECEAWA